MEMWLFLRLGEARRYEPGSQECASLLQTPSCGFMAGAVGPNQLGRKPNEFAKLLLAQPWGTTKGSCGGSFCREIAGSYSPGSVGRDLPGKVAGARTHISSYVQIQLLLCGPFQDFCFIGEETEARRVRGAWWAGPGARRSVSSARGLGA